MSVEKIEKALVAAKDKMSDLGIEEQLVSEIEWCLGSYAHDGNPEGLLQKVEEATLTLVKFKKTNSRKVSKKLIDDLEKVLKAK
ncbi:MAG: hypothetical protein ACI9A7_000256 [Cyclobacteriaceae bacterium]|jgi:hypothetical protein